MKNLINQIPVPKLIFDNCDKTEKGLYVPFVVLKEKDTYHFKINDSEKILECVSKKLCSVCGTELKDDTWFIGGPASVFHKHGAIADLPVHKECGEYSLKVCPYMAIRNYTSKTDIQKLQNNLDNEYKLQNISVNNDRVPVFCFVKAEFYKTNYNNGTFLFKPVEITEVEFHYGGELLSLKEGEEIIKQHFEDKYGLENLNYEFKTIT